MNCRPHDGVEGSGAEMESNGSAIAHLGAVEVCAIDSNEMHFTLICSCRILS